MKDVVVMMFELSPGFIFQSLLAGEKPKSILTLIKNAQLEFRVKQEGHNFFLIIFFIKKSQRILSGRKEAQL